jgi:predicted GIY-YIG superfamily endonuclease
MARIPAGASGIYQIRCVANDKIYIGSAVDIQQRWIHHRATLRSGNHRNKHLQAAWDKYGEDAFEFTILEYASRDDLLKTEQSWMDRLQCTDHSIGFNIYPEAGSPGTARAQSWDGFIDPAGNEVKIINLYEFCRLNQLDFSAMHRLSKGESKLKSYKGWTHRNSVRQRDYIKTYEGFIDPDGNPVPPITNMAEFCRQHGLDNTHMTAVLNGRILSHRGWTHTSSRQPRGVKTYAGFVNPAGESVVITNLREFCREHGLHPVKMYGLISGKFKSHKGWTWRRSEDES